MTDETVPDGRIPVLDFKVEHKFLPISNYSNHMVVQSDAECMYLHFFQLRPPLFLGGDEVPTTVSAEPVICIAVDLSKIEQFISVMQMQFDRNKEE